MNLTKVEKLEVLEDSSAWQFVMGFGAGLAIVSFFGCQIHEKLE